MKRSRMKVNPNRAMEAADYAWREAIRRRDKGMCQWPACSSKGTDCAHIVPRSAKATRCISSAGVLLCRPHHELLGDTTYGFDDYRRQIVEGWIGPHLYEWLLEEADQSTGLKETFDVEFWDHKRAVLEGLYTS